MPKDRILVVEDEAIVARDICKRLEDMGYKVAGTADNGDVAIEKVRELNPDLVLMDIVIKGKNDGIFVAEKIKSEMNIPLIFLTAYTDEETLGRAKITGPFGYVIKPFNDRDLNVTIQMALYRSRMEKKLAEREERYRDLFENTSDIIMLLDEEGRFKYVNQRWYAALGYTSDEMADMTVFEILDQGCLEKCKKNFAKVLSGQESSIEAVFHTRSGDKLIVEGNCNCSISPGKPVWVRGIFRDITEKKRSQILQEALYQIVNETALAGNLDDLYRSLHQIISQLMDTTNFYIALYDKDSDLLTFPYFVDEYDTAPASRPLGMGITEYVIRTRNLLLATPDVYQKLVDKGDIKLVGRPPLDWLGVPLLVSDRYTGVLVVQTYDQGIRFGEREKSILMFISEQVAFAIRRKQSEDDLMKSENRYRTLVDQLPAITYMTALDRDNSTIFISHQCKQILGYEPKEWLDDPTLWQRLLHPDDKERANMAVKKVMSEGVPVHLEYRIHDKQDKMLWAYDYMSLVKDSDGKPLFIQGVMLDITDRKQAEEALKLSEEKYRTLVEQINDVIFLVDPSGVIQYISPVIERITDYSVEDITGQPFSRFIHPDDLPGLNQSFQRAVRGIEEPWEYRILDKNGTSVFVRSFSRLLKDESGEPSGLMGTMTDITQAKQMAFQLQQAQKMEAIGQLAGGIAHDFNNLLAGIMGNAEMLQIKLANEPALVSLADKILTTGEHAASLTRQLLSFARRGNYQQVPVNLHRTIADVAGILTNTIDRNINVRQQLNANICTVLGDPAMLENAMLNLCINARDAMPNGGILTIASEIVQLDEIYIKNHSYKIPEGKYLCLSVSDTGHGMSREIQARIFEPFFTTKEPGKGTGLGLASVYGCVKSHNGSVEVYSEVGHGTTFRIYLPLSENVPEPVEENSGPVIPKGTGNILLVDDEETIRDIAGQMLEDQGYKVKVLANGQEAVDYYRDHWRDIDLVILDMIMPKMNGHEAFLQIKVVNPKVKALLSSGYSIEQEAQELMKSGINGFLQKPYRLTELNQKINQALAS